MSLQLCEDMSYFAFLSREHKAYIKFPTSLDNVKKLGMVLSLYTTNYYLHVYFLFCLTYILYVASIIYLPSFHFISPNPPPWQSTSLQYSRFYLYEFPSRGHIRPPSRILHCLYSTCTTSLSPF